MKKVLKLLGLFLLVVTLVCVFAACGDDSQEQSDPSVDTNKTCHVTLIYKSQEQSQDVKAGSTIDLPAISDKSGYTTIGWCAEIDGERVVWTSDTPITDDIVLTATWDKIVTTYKVEYETNGGVITAEDYPTSYTSEELDESFRLPTPEKEGYNFVGWYDNANFTGSVHTVVGTYDEKDWKYYAKWEVKTYVLRYYTEGGVISSNEYKVSYTTDSKNIALPSPTREGFTFGGWYESPTFDGTALTTFDVKTAANITIYAKWNTVGYTLTLDAKGGTCSQTTIDYVVTNGLIDLPQPTMSGKYFAGWHKDASLSDAAIWQWASTKGWTGTLYAAYSTTKPTAVGEGTGANFVVPAHEDTVASAVRVELLDFNTSDKLQFNGGTKYDGSTPVATSTGDYVRMLNFKGEGDGLRFANLNCTTNWNVDYNTFSVWMYSSAITNAKFGFIFITLDNPFSYRRYDVTVNWQGWKHLTFDINTLTLAKEAAAWSNPVKWGWITYSGWGYGGDENVDSYVYFESMYLSNEVSPYTVQPENITSDDIVEVKDRLRSLLLGTDEVNSNSLISSRTQFSASQINSWIKYMDTTSTTNLWPDLGTVVSNGSNVQTHYERLLEMAKAYATPGSNCYHMDGVVDAVVKGLDWMYNNAYNETTESSGNWWQWDIGAPEALTRTCLILEDELDSKYKGCIDLYMKAVNHFVPMPKMTYANRTWTGYCAFLCALLLEDNEQIVKDIQLMIPCFEYVTSGDGFYHDGSFIQHNKVGYAAGYGASWLEEGTQFLYAIQGTNLAYSQSYIDQWFDLFFDSFATVQYYGRSLCMLSGRGMLTHKPTGVGAGWYAKAFRIVQFANEEDQTKYYNQLASMWKLARAQDCSDVFLDSVSSVNIAQYEEFVANLEAGKYTISYDNYQLLGTAMDRVIQKTDNYMVGLAMSSTRIYRYESINGQNTQGWYEGDGVLYVYSNATDFDRDYWNNMNLYRFPGITCTDAERQAETENTTDDAPCGTYDFVGAVSNDTENSLYNVSVMIFGADTHAKVSKVCGYNEDLYARKAWFMFDDEIVCLGNGIYNGTDSNVYTVVDNRLVSSVNFLVDNAKTTLDNTDKKITINKYAFLTGFGGYYFPESTEVTVKNNSKHIEILIQHGVQPNDATYEYVMLPSMTQEEVKTYSDNPDIEILQNDEECMAVRENTLNMTGYVFFEDNVTCGSVIGKTAGLCMVTENEDGTITMTASEPTQLKSTVEFGIKGLYTVEGDGVVESYQKNGKTYVVFDTKGLQGASVTATLTPAK